MAILGTESKQRGKLDINGIEVENEFELKSRNEWKKRDAEGFSSIHSKRQKKNAPAVDETLIGKRIEVLSSFDLNPEGTETAPPQQRASALSGDGSTTPSERRGASCSWSTPCPSQNSCIPSEPPGVD